MNASATTQKASERPPADMDTLVFPARVRWTASAVAVVLGAVIVAVSVVVPEGPRWYLATLILAAAPFATAGLYFTWRTLHEGPTEYRAFWQRWLAAAMTAYGAGTAALAAVITDTNWLLIVAAVLLIAAVPLWGAASLRMLRAQAGRRAISVDLLDASMALAVLGAPAILVFGEPLAAADHPAFVLPFVASIVFVPAGIYLSFVSLARVPPGERATQGIGMALGGAFAVNATVQIAQVLSDFTLAMWVIVLFQVLNMGLLMAVPLWAHRSPTSVLSGLLPEQQVRRLDPLSFTSAAFLAALAAFAWATREERPWGIALVLGVLVVVVLLSAIRHVMLTRETGRLYAELEQVAEDRRRLLASMVRALEDDRQRMAGELHLQAVESFAALGALIQTAYVTLPPDTARAVKEAISHVQDDLSTRADALRRLTMAVRPPTLFDRDRSGMGVGRPHGPGPTIDEGALATALRAFASEIVDQRSSTVVRIHVDPDLALDWSTTTIVYRIAQEALFNAARHARAATITVEVLERDAAIVVLVGDDGIGFDRLTTPEGSGTASMRLFAELGGGTFEIDTGPGKGTMNRAVLAGRAAPRGAYPQETTDGPRAPKPRHLLLVATDVTASPAAASKSDPDGP